MTVTITDEKSLPIPEEIQRALGISKGTALELHVENGRLVAEPCKPVMDEEAKLAEKMRRFEEGLARVRGSLKIDEDPYQLLREMRGRE